MDITIFNYTDYQAYLKDWYREGKKKELTLSYKSLSAKAGFNSLSYMQRVINGQVALSRKSISNFSDALNHTAKEREYFSQLVHFKHAKNDGEKSRNLRKIQEQTDTVLQMLDKKRFEYLNSWHHVVIRELITAAPFNEDYQRLGRLVVPPISAKLARASVALLVDLELVKKHRTVYIALQNTIVASDEAEHLAMRSFKKKMIDLGRNSIDQFRPSERDVCSITAGVSHKNAERLKSLSHEFQQKIIRVLNEDQEVETVEQINIQIFPLSKVNSKRGS